jgi:uncharacterized protein with HEPN domain
MDKRVEKWLRDILISIETIDEYVGDGSRRFADFANNRMLKQAVERNIEIMGEATNRILKADPDFPITKARKIVDARNYVIHGYDSLDVEMVWNIVINHLPPLKAEVEKLLENS